MNKTSESGKSSGLLMAVNENKKFGAVCATNWSNRDAEIACRTLGFYGSWISWSSIEVEPEEIALDLVSCPGHVQYWSGCTIIKDLGFCYENKVVELTCS